MTKGFSLDVIIQHPDSVGGIEAYELKEITAFLRNEDNFLIASSPDVNKKMNEIARKFRGSSVNMEIYPQVGYMEFSIFTGRAEIARYRLAKMQAGKEIDTAPALRWIDHIRDLQHKWEAYVKPFWDSLETGGYTTEKWQEFQQLHPYS